MTRFFFALIVAALLTNQAFAQSSKQCRAGYSTTTEAAKRTDRNTGAVFLDLAAGTIRTRRDPGVFISPPVDPTQYPLVSSLKISPPTRTGEVEFTFTRPDDGILVKGTLSPLPNGEQQITLAPQKEGWNSATGKCQVG